MAILRSERYAAFFLIIAAVLGLTLANSGVSDAVFSLRDAHIGVPAIGLDLSLGHWVTDGVLAVFFFVAAVELRHELQHGELDSARKALVPAIAAIGGVVTPAIVYLLIAREPELLGGWPIPTATDVAFALGVLALVGRGMPSRVRALLLALAVIDDLIAIIIIAAFFTTELQPLPLLLAVPTVLLFGWLSYRLRPQNRRILMPGMIVLGLLSWYLVHLSGVHATIAAVALGLIMAGRPAGRARHVLEPWSNGLVLPLFAFVAALVVIPAVAPGELSPAFWAIAIALPLGKLLGITTGAVIATRLGGNGRGATLPLGDVIAVAALGGIGFTVSLLMNELAFDSETLADEGTLGVLLGSTMSAVVAALVVAGRARSYAKQKTTARR